MQLLGYKRMLTLTALVGLVVGVAPAHANLLLNPSFEAVDASGDPFFIRNFASTPSWTQFDDGVDVIHNNYTQAPTVLLNASDGVQFLDMNQGGALGGIQQIVASITGATYRLELDTAAWAQNAIGGTIGYQLFDPNTNLVLAQDLFTDNVGGTWVARSLDAVATSSQIGVRIQGLAAQQAGMGLDNVRLNAISAAAPEPSSLLLLSPAALLCLPLVRRRAGVNHLRS